MDIQKDETQHGSVAPAIDMLLGGAPTQILHKLPLNNISKVFGENSAGRPPLLD